MKQKNQLHIILQPTQQPDTIPKMHGAVIS